MEKLQEQMAELQKSQPEFLDRMGMFITALRSRQLEETPIVGSGGLSKIKGSGDTGKPGGG